MQPEPSRDVLSPRILTNMAFWQSAIWKANTDSLYDLSEAEADPKSAPWWVESLRMYVRRARYDAVVSMGARESLAYGLLCALTMCPSKQVMTEVFIDAPRTSNPLWHLKNALFRWVSRRAIGVLTNSSAEVHTISARYRIPEEQLRYVPLHSSIHDPAMSEVDEGYVLAAGRTLRDYPTLLKAARDIHSPMRIICGQGDLHGEDIPASVTVIREMSRDDYLDAVKRCTIVVVPLIKTERSTGQVVVLEAMGYGKPVVATRAPGTEDLVQDGKNGLLVEGGDAAALAAAVNGLLTESDRRWRLGQSALETVRQTATFEIHARAKLHAIEELWHAFSSEG